MADTKLRSLEANNASTRPRTSRQAWTAGTVDTDEPPDDDSDHGEWRPLQKAVTMPRTLDDAEPVSLCTCKCKTPNVDFSRSNCKATHPLSHGLCCVCTVFVCLHAYSQVTELYTYLSFPTAQLSVGVRRLVASKSVAHEKLDHDAFAILGNTLLFEHHLKLRLQWSYRGNRHASELKPVPS